MTVWEQQDDKEDDKLEMKMTPSQPASPSATVLKRCWASQRKGSYKYVVCVVN